MPVKLKDSPKVQRTRLQYATWLGNTTSLIIVADNDIYIRQSPSDEEDVRITFNGYQNLFYNGVPDWLYQGKCHRSIVPKFKERKKTLTGVLFVPVQRRYSMNPRRFGHPRTEHFSCMPPSTTPMSA